MNFLVVESPPFTILIPLGLNIHLSILFSKPLSLRFSLNVRDYVSGPYSTTGNNPNLRYQDIFLYYGNSC
jgi:hypothetical protein